MRQFVPLLRDVKNTAQISGDSWMTSDNNSRGILPANTKSEPFMTIRWVFPSKPYLIFFRNSGKWSRSPRVVAQICTGPSARSRNADEKIRPKIFSWQRRTRRVVALYSWENTWMTTLKELDEQFTQMLVLILGCPSFLAMQRFRYRFLFFRKLWRTFSYSLYLDNRSPSAAEQSVTLVWNQRKFPLPKLQNIPSPTTSG